MNAGKILSTARAIIGDPNDTRIEIGAKFGLLEFALDEIHDLIDIHLPNFFIKQFTFSMPANTYEITMPGDYGGRLFKLWNDSCEMVERSIVDFKLTDTGTPCWYAFIGNSVYVNPTPQQAIDINVIYYRQMDIPTTPTQEIDLPDIALRLLKIRYTNVCLQVINEPMRMDMEMLARQNFLSKCEKQSAGRPVDITENQPNSGIYGYFNFPTIDWDD